MTIVLWTFDIHPCENLWLDAYLVTWIQHDSTHVKNMTPDSTYKLILDVNRITQIFMVLAQSVGNLSQIESQVIKHWKHFIGVKQHKYTYTYNLIISQSYGYLKTF